MSLLRVVVRCSLLCGIFLFGSYSQNANAQAQGPIAARVVEAVNDANRVTLRGNVHPLARAEFDRGTVVDSQPMNRMLLLLKRSEGQEAALQTMLQNQQDKSSGSFHQWLTPEQFGAQFGPADADIQAVTDWLTRQGFSVGKVYSGKTVIEFSGNAGQVQRAFGTAIHNYQVNGKTYSANASDPEIPAALGPVVAGVVSLHNFPKRSNLRKVGVFQKGKPVGPVDPAFSEGFNQYFLAPADFATIYDTASLISAGNNGAGQGIAIVGETDIIVSDIQNFRQLFNLPANFSSANIIVNGEDPGITSTDEETESDLDVEWSGAVAPGAKILFVTSSTTASTAGIDLSALYILEHNLAGVLSESYGDCESNLGSAGNAFYKSLWEQAAAQGITAILSAGDGGSAGCDDFNTEQVATLGLGVSGLASTPYNVSVGGTDFDQLNNWSPHWSNTNDPATSKSALGYIPEMTWNDSCADAGLSGCANSGNLNIVAGSGGPSAVYTSKPSWQQGATGMPNDNKRDQPDISLFAGNGQTGSAYIVCQADVTNPPEASCNLTVEGFTYLTVGGTSAAAPAFAGVMALVNQKTGGRQGNANPVLYQLAKGTGATCNSTTAAATGNSCNFYDVTKGNNSVPCKGATPGCSAVHATGTGILVDVTGQPAWTTNTGYDLASGLGTIDAANLVKNWNSVATVPTKTSLALSPTSSITHGPAENVAVTINVNQTGGTGTPTGLVSLIAKMPDGTTRGLDQFTLSNGSVTGAKTQSLPGGTINVVAYYSGDGTNAPSQSSAIPVTVSAESSQTFIVVPLYDPKTASLVSGNASSVSYGSPYRIRIYVTNGSSVANPTGPPNPTCDLVNLYTCPTGTVILTSSGQPVDRPNGIYQLSDIGYTRDINPTLTGGSYTLAAQYSGDSSYTASSAATHNLTVTPATTRILSSNPPLPDQMSTPFNLAVILTTNVFGTMPSCNFTFTDGTAVLPGKVDCEWQANGPFLYTSIPISQTTSGKHTYTAKFNGDSNYAPSTSAALTTQVFYGTTTTLTMSPNPAQFGSSVTLTAIVDTTQAQGPAISQSVSFGLAGAAVTGSVTYTPFTDASGNMALRATATGIPQGSGDVTATFAGDNNYSSSADLQFITVNIPDFNVPNQVALTVTAGQSASTSFTVTPATNISSQVQFGLQPLANIAPGVNCTVTPNPISLTGQQAANATLNCSVPAASSNPTTTIAVPWWPRESDRDWWILSGVTLLLGWIILLLPARLKKRRLAFACFGVSVIGLALGCGGGGGGSTGGGGGGGTGGGGGGGGQPATPTSISLSVPSTKIPWSSTLVATVSVTGTHTPTGTATLYDSTTGAGINGQLINGQAQLSLNLGGLGAHNLIAKYSGDTKNLASQTQSPLVVVLTGSPGGTWINANTGTDIKTINLNLTVQ